MDRCHYAVPFKGISIKSTPEIVLSSKRNLKLQESEDERRAKQDDKLLYGMNSLAILMGTIFYIFFYALHIHMYLLSEEEEFFFSCTMVFG